MKKTAFFILIFLIMISLSSCQSMTNLLLRVIGEYKTPKPETPESVIEYAKKKNFHYDYLYMTKSDTALIEVIAKGYYSCGTIQPHNHQFFPIKVIPGEGECEKVSTTRFQSSDTTVAVTIADSLIFWDILNLLSLIDKREELQDLNASTANYDYYVIGGWGKMVPKLSKHLHHGQFPAAVSIDSTKNVCLISLNYDTSSGNKFYKDLKKISKQSKKENKKAQKQKRKEM